MALPWSADALIADVRRSGMIPDSTAAGYANADILLQADKEMETRMVPLVLKVRQEYYVRYVDVTTTSGQGYYRLPKRAVAQRTREVAMYRNSQFYSLARMEPEQVIRNQPTNNLGVPYGFKMNGNGVVLVPTPGSGSGTLRIFYYLRPGRLVLESAAQQITAVEVDTPIAGQTRFTMSSTTGLTTGPLDFITNASGAECVAIDVPVVSSTATKIVVSSSYFDQTTAPTSAMVGDWISVADTSPLQQLPTELQGVFAQRVLCRMLQSGGDLQGLRAAEENAKKMEDEALSLIQTRTDGNPQKMIGGPTFRYRSYLMRGV